MATFVHLTPERNARKILQGGIKPLHGSIWAMPVMQNFLVTYQWQRELRTQGQRVFLAIYFRVPDTDLVEVGRYNGTKDRVTAAQAHALLRSLPDPYGYEVVFLRKIASNEIIRVAPAPRNAGWRYYPESHGCRPCPCDFCQRGRIKAKHIRQRNKQSSPWVVSSAG